jgi:RNA polymerase sigma factor (sigma-70 family)
MNSSLQQVAAGDAAAVNDVLDRYGGLVWSIARRMSVDQSDAEDAVQEIFIDLWRNAGRFDPTAGSEPTFIAMLARRRLVDRHRKKSRQLPTATIEAGASGSEVADTRDCPEHSDLLDEAARARDTMCRLKPEERRVLELAVYEGRSHSEIATLMQLPLGTVKTHSRRGLIRLREMLGVAPREPAQGGLR